MAYHPGMGITAAETPGVRRGVAPALVRGAAAVAAVVAIVRIVLADGSVVARGLGIVAVVLAAALIAHSWQAAAQDRRVFALHVAALASLLVAAGALVPTSLAAGLIVAAALRLGRDIGGWPGLVAVGVLALAHAARGSRCTAPMPLRRRSWPHALPRRPRRRPSRITAPGACGRRTPSRSTISTASTCVAMSLRTGVPEEFAGRGIPPPTDARGFRLSLDVAEPWAGGTIDGRVESIADRPANPRPLTVTVSCIAAWVDVAPQLVGRAGYGLGTAYELRARWRATDLARQPGLPRPRPARAARYSWPTGAGSRSRCPDFGAAGVRGHDVRVPLHRRGVPAACARAGILGPAAAPGRAAPRTRGARRDHADRHLASARSGGPTARWTPEAGSPGKVRLRAASRVRPAEAGRVEGRRDPPPHGAAWRSASAG